MADITFYCVKCRAKRNGKDIEKVTLKNGKPASSTFDYGGSLTEMVLLGVLAMRFKDTPLEWDPEKMRITNHEPANQYINPTYREGWTL